MKPNLEELERVHYNGLTTADKGALLDAKARGAEWVARDEDEELVGFRRKPKRYIDMESTSDHWERTESENYFIAMPNDEPLQFIQWSDPDPVNIDLALAQIAEMETAQTPTIAPLTWNERINQMTVEEKGEFFAMFNCPTSLQSGYDCSKHANCIECMTAFFASPYTEGANQ